MEQLHELPNISKVLAKKLETVGIDSPVKLKQDGSKAAFVKIRIMDHDACINTLYALEGALQNIRWHHLDKNIKTELKEFYQYISYSTTSYEEI